MKIRTKLAWVFILLLLFGINGISSYSIVFIHNYLLKQGVKQIRRDARWVALTVENLNKQDSIIGNMQRLRKITDYNIALYGRGGRLLKQDPEHIHFNEFAVLPDSLIQELKQSGDSTYVVNKKASNLIYVYVHLHNSQNPAQYIQLSQYKATLFEPIKTIRWIIYTGIFISIGLVIIVSALVARSFSRPILQLTDAAHKIADGDVNQEIHLKRKDEFGTLAESLNQMAQKLRSDNENLKLIYEKQRQFYADITHEVRNPLHTIMGSLDMLELENLGKDKQDKYINNAKNQVDRINRLFKDLMTLQRFDSDQQFIQKEPFDISKVTTRINDWYREEAKKKGITLVVDKQSMITIGDPPKIEQVFDNLVSNAVKYSQAKHIYVRYKKEADFVNISVCDDGIGIPDEHLSRLFDRFYRTDKARSRDKGGTGLGLAVVKGILNAHNSDIHVKSEVGKGTCFTFRLPVARQFSS